MLLSFNPIISLLGIYSTKEKKNQQKGNNHKKMAQAAIPNSKKLETTNYTVS